MARHGSQTSFAPAPRLPATAAEPLSAAAAELLLAPRAKPEISERCLVRTPQMIGGQHEHAAMITRVLPGDAINVLLMPDGQEPYPISGILPAESPTVGAITWRWPPRS